MPNITSRLFEIAAQEHISQREIAKASGISEESLSRGKKRGSMNIATIEKIADSLGLEVQIRKKNSISEPKQPHCRLVFTFTKEQRETS